MKQHITDDDYEFVVLCRQGDLSAFEALVHKHQKGMVNTAYRLLGSYEDACEVVQDAFVAAYKNLKGFKGDALFSTWLYRIVLNLSKNRMKQLKSIQLHQRSLDDPLVSEDGEMRQELPAQAPSALEQMEKRELQEKVQRCISALEEEYRAVLVLRDIQGFSYDEIRDMLKVPSGTVKSRLFRARESVKHCLTKALGAL